MPYKSTKQRGYIHAQAAKGVKWAIKFVGEADKAKQPKNERAKSAAKKKMRRK
jgi:hypothetical protein